MQFSPVMYTLLTVLVCASFSHGHQYVGPSSVVPFGQRPTNPSGGWSRGTNVHLRAWGPRPSSSSSSASYPSAKGLSGPYRGGTGPYPPRNIPPRFDVPFNPSIFSAPNPPPVTVDSQTASSRASPGVKGSSLPYRRGPPPRFGGDPYNPSRGYAPNTPPGTINAQAAIDRIGGDQPPGPNTAPATKCRAGDKVYKVGDKWTPEGRCGRHTCAVGGKTSFLGCPRLEPTTDCALSSEDPRQPWPSCCPQLRCSR